MAPANKLLRLGIEVTDEGSIRVLDNIERGYKKASDSAKVFGAELDRIDQRQRLLQRGVFDQQIQSLSGFALEGKNAAQSASVFTRELDKLDSGGRMAVMTNKEMAAALGVTTGAQSLLTGAVMRYAAPAAIGYAIAQTIDYADQLAALSQRSGWTVEGLQGIDAAASANRTSLQAVINASDTLSERLTSDSDSVSASLQTAGLSFEQLFALNPEERFLAAAAAVREIQDPLTQARVRADLFGRSGREIAALLNADIPAAMDSTIKMSGRTAEALSKMDNLWERTKQSGKAFLAETLAPLADTLTGLAAGDFPKATAGALDFAQGLTTTGRAARELTGLTASQEWRNLMDALWNIENNPQPNKAPRALAIGEAFKAATFNAKELLEIEADLTKQSAELDRAWKDARDDFFGDAVLREAEQDLQYITNLHDLVRMSPEAFASFQQELTGAKARLDLLGDSASTAAEKIRTTLAAMQAMRNVPAEGGPMMAPGDVFGAGVGMPLGPDVLQITPAMIADEWKRAIADISQSQQELDAENQRTVQSIYDEWVKGTTGIADANGQATSTMSSQWGSFASVAVNEMGRVESAAQRAWEFLRRSEAQVQAYREAGLFVQTTSFASAGYDASMQNQAGRYFGSSGGYVWRPTAVRYFAGGGPIRGTDTVRAMLTPGEGVLSRTGMAALDRLNSGRGFGSGPSIVIHPGAIVIHAAPGQNEQAIADAVERRFVQLTGYLPSRV